MSENEEKNEAKPMDTDQNSPTEMPTPQVESIASESAPTPGPEERMAVLESEKAELKDRMLRIAADFDNWKKRSRKELADAETKSKESVLKDFLEVVDNLERATSSFADGKEGDLVAVKEGVGLVLRLFQSKFERYQVKALDAKGAAFDPRLHEAISQIPTPGAKPGTVVQELQKGYFIGERLLRPAMVVVAAATPTPAPDASKNEPNQDKPAEG